MSITGRELIVKEGDILVAYHKQKKSRSRLFASGFPVNCWD
jgi:hypothetical protein